MASISTATPKVFVSHITSQSPSFSPPPFRFTLRRRQIPSNPSISVSSRYHLKTTILSSQSPASVAPHRCRPDYISNRITDPHYLRVLDTTLRDGEQSPGATLTSKEKVDIARQLAKLGVDIIEGGFLSASNEDFEAVKTIAKEIGNAVDEDGYVPVICGLSRYNEKDIRTAWEAVKGMTNR